MGLLQDGQILPVLQSFIVEQDYEWQDVFLKFYNPVFV